MILPDVNVLLYAFRGSASEHAVYAGWLNAIRNTEDLLLPDAVLLGFVRVITNPGATEPPVSTAQAFDFVDRLTAGWVVTPRGSRIMMGCLHELIENDPGIRGRLLPDAYLAATALAHNARLATRDRGFARYPGLRWFDPADEV